MQITRMIVDDRGEELKSKLNKIDFENNREKRQKDMIELMSKVFDK